MLKTAAWELSPTDAVMFAVVSADTPVVETVKVAFLEPDGTVTVSGTVAFKLSEESEKVAPPVGAGEPSVTVPVTDAPPATVDELKDRRELPLCVNWATVERFP